MVYRALWLNRTLDTRPRRRKVRVVALIGTSQTDRNECILVTGPALHESMTSNDAEVLCYVLLRV